MADKQLSNIEMEAITYLQKYKQSWETATAFVTDRVSFQMRNLIRELRKNYWGIYKDPVDIHTGLKKTWIPLTEYTVETACKNIDIDTKEVQFISKKPGRSKLNLVLREKTREVLDEIDFGRKLNEMIRQLGIDGTAIWKVMEKKVDGRIVPDIMQVDVLNWYIDPTAKTIEDTPLVIERSIMIPDEIKEMDGWDNTENVFAKRNVNLYDSEYNYGNTTNEQEYVEVYEAWGLIPKSLITGNSEDRQEKVEGHIVISNLGTDSKVHLIEKNIKGKKPYIEFWYTKVPNRWFGKGIAEKLLMIQAWINTVVNTRILRNRVAQLGLFKIRQGQGITAQMLSALPVNGAIQVKDMGDIEQFVVQEATQSSYNDENVALEWGQRVTSAFETVTGESVPASITATTSAIQQQSASSEFKLVREGIGIQIEKMFRDFFMPIIKERMTKEDVVRIMLDGQELREFDEELVDAMVSKYITKVNESGDFLDEMEVAKAREQAKKHLNRIGQARFLKLTDDIDMDEFDVKVTVSDEQLDKNILVQDLIQTMQVAPQYADQIIEQMFDLVGLRLKKIEKEQMMNEQKAMKGGGMPNVPGLAQQMSQATQVQPAV
ncbi:hypothetical protein M0R04_12750 [Candidatus Dojkabacteria bacterium]|jgi:hypothetical protein|nr:hypothetical protein [Candidatus Dojkabacteria bacterium]